MSWLERIVRLLSGPVKDDITAIGASFLREKRSPSVDAQFRQGAMAFSVGNYAEAAHFFNAVTAARHDDSDAYHYLGLARLKLGDLEEAADNLAMAVHHRPSFVDAWYHLALVMQQREQHREAVKCLERAIALRTDYAEAYNALGVSILALGNALQAVVHFEQAVALGPNCASSHSNLGCVLFRDLGEYERGAAHIRAALNLDVHDRDVRCNYLMVLLHEGQLETVITESDRLLAENPDCHEARFTRSLALLKLGRFASAWSDFEARKQMRSNYVLRPYRFPEWQGESLQGKTVLVFAEQGLGDEIMFASCLADLMQLGGNCVVECSSRLEGLLRRSFPGVIVHGAAQTDQKIDWLERIGPIDFQISIGSLPSFFRRDFTDFPQHSGYLFADEMRVAHWRKQLAKLGDGLKVGISWRGGTASTRHKLRSTHLKQWLPLLLQSDKQFVSLQYGDCLDEIEAIRHSAGITVHHWQAAIDDYSETAALVCALDIVISVQTAVVFLAGALGKPVWVLVSTVPEWCYLQSGDHIPWCPSARLFRQLHSNDWEHVIMTASAELAQLRRP